MSKSEPTEKSARQTDMVKYGFKVVDSEDFRLWKYGWVDITCCRVSGFCGHSFIPADFFANLLDHDIYRQDYGSMRAKETGDIHGPFLISRLNPSDFVEISFDEWIGHINARYADPEGPPDKRQTDAIEDYINGLPKEEMRYFRLAADHEDPDYHHELWFIHTFFDEYILLNPQHETMWLMVMGED